MNNAHSRRPIAVARLAADTAAPVDEPGGSTATPAPPATEGLLRRIGEDFRWALADFVLSDVGGSKWVPRVARRMIFTAAGAKVQSAPGIRFVFAGQARNLTLGSGIYMNQRVFIEAVGPVSIGDDVIVRDDDAGCIHDESRTHAMGLTSHHPLDDAGAWQADAEGRPVSIGERVWIGARALILPGAVIESDVVIAAGAVVTGRCNSFGVYAGVPARRIRDYSGAQPQR